jgi:small subunit ribosomal protein S3
MIERTFIKKNYNKMELDNYLAKKLDRAGYSNLEIIKTPLVTRIVLHVAKPGLAIGKSGATIKELTEVIGRDFEIDNPQIEIQEIKNPNLNARIVVARMSAMINRGFSWRSVAFRTVKDINAAGAQGIELVFKGALGGKGARKRKQRIAVGYMKKIGDQAKFVDTAKASANPKIGAIGIKLSIIHPEVVFPDKIDVVKVVAAHKALKNEAIEQEKAAEDASAETTKEETTDDKKTEVKEEKAEKPKKEVEAKTEKKEEAKTEKVEEKKKDGILDKVKDKVEHVVEEVKEEAAEIIDKIEDKLEHKEEKVADKKEVKEETKEEKK